jgi:predicted ATP-dependent endonuclease of OLD family
MTAVLEKFRVRNFRSVNDSGWINTNDLTALIGTNEAGKTNLLLPLWKLRPANGEPIDALVDYPRQKYSTYKSEGDNDAFVEADFILNEGQQKELSEELNLSEDIISHIRFARYWNGKYSAILLSFYEGRFDGNAFSNFFNAQVKSIEPFGDFAGVEKVKEAISNLISKSKKWDYKTLKENLGTELKALEELEYEANEVQRDAINDVIGRAEKIQIILDSRGYLHNEMYKIAFKYLPSFVYYSDYGNLNSEIYLPRVIEDLAKPDLKGIERDKTRTLKVLFDFVRLSPNEILELGNEQSHVKTKTDEIISGEARKKKEREILLFSASTSMTTKFKEWWKQGDYRFRFQADGNHFRIWVSDDRRPEEIELESRSRGLQWFFSFFLVFLVESRDEHSGCILLLDEPGVTLHPSAQEDLIEFFKALSQDNQVVYTTHSPFLIDSSNLGNVKAVYVDENGHSAVSTDLRRGSKVAEKSVYPAHAAIGLTISETFLNGCQPVLVEGVSDQIYLHSIKTYLVKNGVIKPERELVFIPTGGVKGMKPIINIISSKDATLPVVVLDSDNAGKKMAATLLGDLYSDDKKKMLEVDGFVQLQNAEIEDLIPKEILLESFDRRFRIDEFALADDINENEAFLPQAESYATKHDLVLNIGWKVDLAKDIVKRLPKKTISGETQKNWKSLFEKILKNS